MTMTRVHAPAASSGSSDRPEQGSKKGASQAALFCCSPVLSDRPIARPGDLDHVSAQLEYMQTLLAREQRRAEVLQNTVKQARLEADEAKRQLAALRASTSWRLSAPLRWLAGAFSRGSRQ